MSDDTSTYARPSNRAGLLEPDQLCDLCRDQLGNITHRSALEAWLAHPRTARFFERLRFSPGHAALYREMMDLVAAARETCIDDRPTPTDEDHQDAC